jgi:MFS family permease
MAASLPAAIELTPAQILSKGSFWLLWLLYFIGAGAGLMVIGSISSMAKKSMGTSAFIAVAVLAIGNALGRVVAGSLSDRI